ncbi:MAG: hypothetical protein PHW27_10060 [Melioribacteraceae bacterium]|nr:hypothetical protein [Melioribacteraceae bacterium]
MNLIGTSTLIENRNRTSAKPKLLDEVKHKIQLQHANTKTITNRKYKYSPVEIAADSYIFKTSYNRISLLIEDEIFR